MKTINRRTVLRGVGGTAIALPFLEAMQDPRPARADSAISKVGINGRPKRFMVVWTSAGQGDEWWKNESAADGTITKLGPVMAPLEKHQRDLILIDGMGLQSLLLDLNAPVNHGHEDGGLHLTTCARIHAANKMAGGISIDQAIAKEVSGGTKFPSLQLAVAWTPFANTGRLSFSGPGVCLFPIDNPQTIFDRLFSDFKTDPKLLEAMRAQRKSLLDNVKAQYDKFVTQVSGEDRIKVQAHLDGLRQIEKQVGDGGGGGASSAACSLPPRPANRIVGTKVPILDQPQVQVDPELYRTDSAKIFDLVAMAFACDLTRVVTLAFDGGTGNAPLPWVNVDGMHRASHGDMPARNRSSAWHSYWMGTFFDRLKALSDGPSGTVFDNTLFYWTTEHGTGNHNSDHMPTLIAGSAGGYFKTGRRLIYPSTVSGSFSYTGPGHGDLFVSFLNAMGVPATTFGIPEVCKGALPRLTS